MESAKEKAIREAYGERYEGLKQHLDENGWFPDEILGEEIWVLSECERRVEHKTFITDVFWRISGLEGIENNNGWNLTSEKLPTDLKSYACLENGKNLTIAFYTKGHEVGFEDWDDYEEYDEVEERDGTLYLKPGWYEECEQQNSA